MQLQILDLGRIPFDTAFQCQEQLAAARRQEAIGDTLLLAEHDPVYTLGRHADPRNILEPAGVLAQRGIPVVRTTRGGQVTYHGPGQMIGYPILKLPGSGKGVARYVSHLETVLIQVLARFGMQGHTDPVNRGVWIGNAKVAALGIRVSGRVTMHGFSLNVTTHLDDYRAIIPCGIQGRGVTSMHLHCPDITLARVKPVLIAAFQAVFGYTGTITGPVPASPIKETA